jgi:hypothetical protein
MPGGDVEAFYTCVKRTIAEKNTPFGTESKFIFVVGAESRRLGQYAQPKIRREV